MPQLANLVLTDRAGTPVNHTFVPESNPATTGVASVAEYSGVPFGNNRVALSLNKTPTGRFKAKLAFSFPVVQTETVNGISNPKLVRTAFADLTFTFADNSSEQERKDAVGMVQSSLDAAKTMVNDMLVKLQAVY